MHKLLPSAKVAPVATVMAPSIVSNKCVGVANWPDLLNIRNQAVAYISKEMIPKKCYIGEELILRQNIYFVLTSPSIKQLTASAHLMMESGLYSMWEREFFGLTASPRVPGRVRMVSPTKFLEEEPPARVLKLLEGKLRNVFFRWIICASVCLLTFATEKAWKYHHMPKFVFEAERKLNAKSIIVEKITFIIERIT